MRELAGVELAFVLQIASLHFQIDDLGSTSYHLKMTAA